MKSRLIKAILPIFIILVPVLNSCSSPEFVKPPSNHKAYESFSFDAPEENDKTFADYTGLSNMKKVAADGKLELYIDENSMNFAVKNTASGKVWYSTPLDNNEFSGKQSAKYRALVSLELNSKGQLVKLNSFENCVKQDTYRIIPVDKGVKIEMSIGEKRIITSLDLPQVVEKGRFENRILNKLDEEQKKDVLRRYNLYSMNDKSISKHEIDAIAKEYPIVRSRDVYIIKRGIPDYAAEKIYDILNSIGYTVEDINQDHQENMITIEAKPLLKFDFEMELLLQNDALVAKLDCSRIRFNKDMPLAKIRFLELFGAGSTENKDGFLFVPDGSGAVIDLINENKNYSPIEIKLYGEDKALDIKQRFNNTEQAVLPVFGMKNGNDGFVAIIERGDTVAGVCANTAGIFPYSSVYSAYDITTTARVDAGYKNTSEKQFIDIVQTDYYNKDIVVNYIFLENDVNIGSMAKIVRDRLAESGVLTKTLSDGDIPFNLELIGSIDKNGSILGILPKRTQIPLTTFPQAKTIVDKLLKAGIKSINLRYLGAFDGGLFQKSTDKLSENTALGGAKELQNLNNYLKSVDIPLYLDVNLLTVLNRKGFNTKKYAARTLGDSIANNYIYDLATGNRFDMRTGCLLYPSVISHFTGKVKNNRLFEFSDGISFADLGKTLYSDFRKRNGWNRDDTLTQIDAAFMLLSENKKVMTDTANVYSWKYSDVITNLPMDSSRFKSENMAVPFVQMVLHGKMDYSGMPVNNSYDYKYAMLRSVSFGGAPNFRWIYESSFAVTSSYYNDNKSANYLNWFDKAVEYYDRANEVLSKVRTAEMTAYDRVTENVYKTVYDNGVEVFVNYGTKDETVDGITVKAEDFVYVG